MPDGAMPEKSCEELTMTVEKGLKRLSLVDGTPPPKDAAQLEARCNEEKVLIVICVYSKVLLKISFLYSNSRLSIQVLFKDFKAYKKCLKSNKLTEQIFSTSTKSIGRYLRQLAISLIHELSILNLVVLPKVTS